MQSVRELTMADAPRLELIFAADVSVGPPLDCGDVGKGARRIVPITGGEFSGPNLRGKVLPGGADWQILRGDGVSELEARYTLQTDDGPRINGGTLALGPGPPGGMAGLAAGRAADHCAHQGASPRSARGDGGARRRPACRARQLLLPRRSLLRDQRRA